MRYESEVIYWVFVGLGYKSKFYFVWYIESKYLDEFEEFFSFFRERARLYE